MRVLHSGRLSTLGWALLIAIAVLAAACAVDATSTPRPTATLAPPTSTPLPPPTGNTLVFAYDGSAGTYLPSYVLKAIFEDHLGYDVRVSDQSTIPLAFESVSRGRTDIFTSAWFPARDSTLDKYPNLIRLGQVYGGKDRDAFEGWMVSADFARQNRISHVRDLSSPELARALDTDGNGKGNLMGCPADWVCAGRHSQILSDFGLSGMYEVEVPASEADLLSSVESRLKSGNPALFYMYQPVAFPGGQPIEARGVWLEVTKAYLPLAFNRAVVRGDFIANYPAAAKILSKFRIPGKDVGAAMGRIIDKGDSPKFIEEVARDWIEANRPRVDEWLAGIAPRTPSTDLPSETLTVAYTPEVEDLFLKLAIEFNVSRPPDVAPVEPMMRGMGEVLDGALAGEFAAIVPDSSLWLDQLDKLWQQRNPGSTALVGPRTRYALSPIVIAMWRDTAADFGYPGEPVGWDDLIRKASRDPRFRWSHSSPRTASGLLTTTAEFYAGAGKSDNLTKEDLISDSTRDFVRSVEETVRRYGGESEDRVVIRMLAEGGRPLDAFVAQEQWVIYYNRNSADDKLVAIYPEEGTFWMDHPLVQLDGNWVTEGQRRAFREFSSFVKAPERQRLVLREGYRPAELGVSLQDPDSLIRPDYGADPSKPQTLLKVPGTAVLENIREAWRLLKKPANIYLVADVSGSMSGGGSAQRQGRPPVVHRAGGRGPRRGGPGPLLQRRWRMVELGPANRPLLEERILGLQAGGGTELYKAVAFAYDELQRKADADRINVIVAMTDGMSSGQISDIESRVQRESFPVLIFTVGYGRDADFDVLLRIARLGEGQAYPSDSETIGKLYELLSAFF